MSDNLITTSGLEKAFPGEDGEIRVLDGLDFALAAGESVSVRGESGSGKSTFLNVVSGLESADGGRIEWAGRDVSKHPAAALARRRTGFIGFVFQSYYLVPELNALENVLLGARIGGPLSRDAVRRARALLERVGMGHRVRHPSTKLSGGERQRVAVARALINRPRIVLADEPTGNLDEHTAGSVMELLLRLVAEESTALVLVTHNPDFAARTDRQLLLHNGRLSG